MHTYGHNDVDPSRADSRRTTRGWYWFRRALLGTGLLTLTLSMLVAGRHLRASARANIVPADAAMVGYDDLDPYRFEGADRLALTAMVDGQPMAFPVLDTDVSVDVQGDVANVTVVQTFENPATQPVHATYVFPLPHEAAVHAMIMEVGNERVRAVIDRIEAATETFQQAQQAGQAAALVTQERPNVFTQRIANLVPGLPIRIEIRYVQTVPRVNGRYELAVPLVVGPRFDPLGTGQPHPDDQVAYDGDGHAAVSSITQFAAWELEHDFADNPLTRDDLSDRVAIQVHLDGGMRIREARSTTHPMLEEWQGDQAVDFTLADGRVPDDRDFVLTYAFDDDEIQAGLLSHFDDRGGYFTLRIEPPASPTEAQIARREVVFVLDTSGSMSGLPMEASKAFAIHALRDLRPTDTFRVIRFGDEATEYATRAQTATPANVEAAVEYVEGLEGMGGTAMNEGIRQALTVRETDEVLRLVVFLTDGYIGNDASVLDLLDRTIGDARLFAFGVGNAVNRFLLDEMGRRGRGFTRIMSITEDPAAVAAELAARIQSPVLTHVWVDWGDMGVSDVYPERLPDVFAGHSIRLSGRYAEPQSATVTVHGRVDGRAISFPVEVDLADRLSDRSVAIPLVWAQEAIADRMAQFTVARHDNGAPERDLLKEEVTQLGLDHSLVTQWTAFVAVSEQIVNNDVEGTTESGVPASMVDGLSAAAYQTTFGGSSAPEPITWLALLTAGAVTAAGRRRR